MSQTFPMNQESSLISITTNNTGEAVGRQWPHTSITSMVGVGGWEGLRKHLYLYCLLCTVIQALPKLKLLLVFFILLFLHPLFTSCKSTARFWLSSKLQIISECGKLIQKVMFHFNSSTCVQVHISLVDPASNSFFKVNTSEACMVHMESG